MKNLKQPNTIRHTSNSEHRQQCAERGGGGVKFSGMHCKRMANKCLVKYKVGLIYTLTFTYDYDNRVQITKQE